MKLTQVSDEVTKDVLNWISAIKNSANFKVKDITLDQAQDWSLDNGIIHHSSNRFFKVVGVKFKYPDGHLGYQPLIEQREIGTLGFIWRNNSLPELLVQAKIEPGNVGIVQLAPSCQATESNADRVHGGEISPFSDLFGNKAVNIISSSLQSEQGTRFLGKLNRNVLATLKTDTYSDSYIHKWVPVDEVLKMLQIDYLLNTDARSVLVCSDWERLVGRKPFCLDNSDFTKELSISFNHRGLFKTNKQTKDEIISIRDRVVPPEVISLYDLPKYKVNRFGVHTDNKKPFIVKYIDIKTKYREVVKWNQPIIESAGLGKINLICGRLNGVLHFLFKPTIEPGLVNKVELSPSEVIEPGEEWPKENKEKRKILIQSWQSDEGGRFYQDKSLYSLIDLGNITSKHDNDIWLSLKQVKELLNEGRWLTNEARSSLSLLLVWI